VEGQRVRGVVELRQIADRRWEWLWR
jgi:hypothetical protein